MFVAPRLDIAPRSGGSGPALGFALQILAFIANLLYSPATIDTMDRPVLCCFQPRALCWLAVADGVLIGGYLSRGQAIAQPMDRGTAQWVERKLAKPRGRPPGCGNQGESVAPAGTNTPGISAEQHT